MLPHLRLAVDEENRRATLRRFHLERRIMRSNSDPFSLQGDHFIQLFRLNKEMVSFLFDEIGPYMNNSSNYNAVSPQIRLFATLAFYATGSYQRVIGQFFNLSISQQSTSRAVEEVSSLIVEHLSDRLIVFPQTNLEKNRIKEIFMVETRFPGVIGAIDCTHVAILCPKIEEHNYFNRKGYHSKNIQIICSYDLKILNINARYPGSCHDAFIWRNSAIQEELRRCFQEGDTNSWLLGDSGYPQQPWLMTPILNAEDGSPEERYNARHRSSRNCIERCNGVLKGRFRCLMNERKLRYSPEKVGNIAVACAVLHNICISGNIEAPQQVVEEPDVHDFDNRDLDMPLINVDNRNLLIQRYFL